MLMTKSRPDAAAAADAATAAPCAASAAQAAAQIENRDVEAGAFSRLPPWDRPCCPAR
jgi:hypothetical protein